MKNSIILLLLLVSTVAISQVKLDGILDEDLWASAQKVTDMRVVDPYTLATPEYKTEIKVTSDAQGMYFGIVNWQPVGTRNLDTSARDRGIGSDKNQIIIDFDNNAIIAYSFEVGIGGSIRDGIYSNENSFSNEWDGNWSAKTSSTDDYWVAEVLIPWDVVSMKKSSSELREIKWYVGRTIADKKQVYASVEASDKRQRFLRDFKSLTLKDYASSSFALFGSATLRNDFHNDKKSADVGLDLFWKSGNGKQLTATINPDFGQIESDRLVVNFSATETFFNERRPFFTENQALFDVRGANGLRVLHTRRIGARPDAGDEKSSDIDVAVKYTDTREASTFGVFAASESTGVGFEGRDYIAGRFLHQSKNQTFGVITTYVDRADINRKAYSYAFDHEYLWGESIKLKSQIIGTNTEQEDSQNSGWGGWSQLQQQITPNRHHYLEISHYGKDFEINDFGFLPRNNLNTLYYQHILKKTEFKQGSHLQQREYNFNITHRGNDNGESFGQTYRFSDSWQFKDASLLSWDVRYKSQGVDDLISRGNGLLNKESGYDFRVTYRSNNANKLRYHGFIKRFNEFNDSTGYEAHLHPSYFFQDNYSASLSLFYTKNDDWLNWQNDDLFGRYNRELLNTTLDFNANFSQKQELRIRFQWLAIDAQANQQYQLNNQGDLQATNDAIDDFSLSNTALQIRYRYEIAPLSNIFIVYTRGGSVFEENSHGLFSLFQPGFSNVRSDNFLIKLRYNFF
jgi:predicted nucleotidyltransferase